MSDMQTALRNSQLRYQHLIESMPLGVMITQNGLIKFCNPVAIEMSGYDRKELLNHSFLPLIHPDDRARTMETHARRMRGEIDFVDYEIRGIRKDGAQRLWRLRVQTIDWDGAPAGLTVLTDNTDAREAEIHLRELSSIVEQADDAIMLTTVDGTIKYINPGFERLSGWRSSEVLGKKPSLFKSGAQDEHFYRQLWETLLAGKPFNGHVINRNKSGSDYHVFKSITPMFDADGKIASYVNIDKDFGIQHEVQQRLEHQAMHDSLTGVPNRSLLEDRIRQSIARHQREPSPFALLFIDLDDFKKINDWLGHDAGDEVLKHIAARLLANTRPMDTVARLGGDEFVVLLQGVAALDQAAQVGSKLIKAIDEPMVLQGETCRVGASIGVSLYPADASDWQTLMSRADSAMYRAKRAGGNRLDNNGDPLTQPAPL
jgi:diguanylate cyclase (GGDEF)-like protein/PAS domain S-box-containing protein